MMSRLLLVALVAVMPVLAQAQSSPVKKELVAKVLQLQQAGIEGLARALVEQPAVQISQQLNAVLQRVPADKREALARDLQADLKRYVDESVPIVRERAVKLAPSTIGAVLDERFSEDELRQVIQLLESPINRKLQSVTGDMQRSLTTKLAEESRPLVQPKLQALDQSLRKRLADAGAAPPASAPR